MTAPTRDDGQPAVMASLTGTVVAATTHEVVAAAVVSIVSSDGASRSVRLLAPDGRFAERLPAGAYELRASAPGFAMASPQRLDLSGSTVTSIELVVHPVSGGLQGTVSDLESGVLAGAHIDAVDLGWPRRASLSTVADAAGRYRLALPDGAYAISVGFDGYVSASRRVQVAGGLRTEHFVLSPAGTIRGRVVRADGGVGVQGACVQAATAMDGAGLLPTPSPPCSLSAADGSFEITGLLPGTAALTASVAGFGTLAPVEVPLGIGETVEGIDIVVQPGTDVSGRVVRIGGDALANVAVVVLRPAEGSAVVARGVSGHDGRFTFPGLAAGRYLLRTEPSAGAVATASRAVEVPTAADVLLEVDSGRAIRGRVVPGGAGRVRVRRTIDEVTLTELGTIASAEAMLSAEIDASGAFALEGVPEGRWQLVASTEAGEGVTNVVVADRDLSDVTIDLGSLASLCGQVREATGAALGPVTVHASRVSQPISAAASGYRKLQFELGTGAAPAADDGRFCLRGLDPGTYLIVARDGHQALMWSERHLDAAGNVAPVELGGGERREGWVLEVHRPRARLTGRVIDEHGRAVVDAHVTGALVAAGGTAAGNFPVLDARTPIGPVVTDENGRFTIETLPASHRLVASKASEGLSGTLDAAPGADVTIVVSRGGSIVGSTRGGRGGCRVRVSGPREAAIVGQGEDCAFRFDRLPPGRYQVTAQQGSATGSKNVDVRAGEVTRSDLEVISEVSVSARVIDGAGQPVRGVIVLGMSTEGSPAAALEAVLGTAPRTDERGAVVVRVAPGPVALAVLSRDGKRVLAARKVDVGPTGLDVGSITVQP